LQKHKQLQVGLYDFDNCELLVSFITMFTAAKKSALKKEIQQTQKSIDVLQEQLNT